ncbi:glycosyltransferase family 25 protein [Helicobacter cetorum]|uniref:glycosyltransferase family 25 protein n=1 Tax=Helicobacter cetorum TaxID=138563 RepID=UPI000CF032D8|nr:glycosyltransferase family 25 protein [Helicobacter cetorum]
MEIRIISLKDSSRYESMQKLCKNPPHNLAKDFQFSIFDAISPSSPHFEGLRAKHYDKNRLKESDWVYCKRGAELEPNELGCYMSHFLLWQECVSKNTPIVICEDDIELKENFKEAVMKCLKSPFDLVRLHAEYWGYRGGTFQKVLPRIENEPLYMTSKENLSMASRFKRFLRKDCFKLYQILRRCYYPLSMFEKESFLDEHFYMSSLYLNSCACYYLTPNGAKILIEKSRYFTEPSDIFLSNSPKHKLPNIVYMPLCVKFGEASLQTTICLPKHFKKVFPYTPKRLIMPLINLVHRLRAYHCFKSAFEKHRKHK